MALVTRARAAGILAICLLMLSAPGALAVPTYQPDAQIRLGSGSFVGDNIYHPNAAQQRVFNTGVVDQKLTFFIKIQHDGIALTDSFKVRRSAGFTNGYRVRYYNAVGTDVTGQVTNGSFTTPPLGPGGEYGMRATVKIKSWATLCSFTSRYIRVTSTNNSNVTDAVQFTAALDTPALNCPPFAGDDANSITEDADPNVVFGQVRFNDNDADGDPLMTNPTGVVNGSYGTFSLISNGQYSYTLNNSHPAVQALNNNETLTDPFTYTDIDGNGGTSNTATVTITIHGVTDT